MADRVYPSAKPVPNGAAAPATTNPSFPANKAQLYNTTRPTYRPQPPPKRRHKRCSCCLWSTLIIILILLLAAIAAAVFYVMYRPQRPSFSITNVQLSRFNLTDTTLISDFNITVLARNPNSKITFSYDPTAVRIFSGGQNIGDGSFSAFTQGKKSVTTLRSVVSRSGAFPGLRSGLRSRSLQIKIQLDTKVEVKAEKMDTKKVAVRVTCDGIRISVPSGRTPSVATISNVKCKVDPRIKIVRWTV